MSKKSDFVVKKQYVKYPRVQCYIDPGTGLTHQSFKDQCNINNLVENWLRTGVATFTSRSAQYADVSDLPDPHSARAHLAYANQQFALLSDEDQKKYGTPLAYFEALLEASKNDQDELGTDSSLVVTVPSDRKVSINSDEEGGDENEEIEDAPSKIKKAVQSYSKKST